MWSYYKAVPLAEGLKRLRRLNGPNRPTLTQPVQYLPSKQLAWKLWKYSNKALDLMDPSLGDPPSTSMLLRYIKIGLLCVQRQIPDDRPTMSDVISMIVKDRVSLPEP
ncbi:hypothetical protein NC651_012327 [Populus alba x Populus x berolinensis]|nr:hypothetical protein NC651_012327 [Populus alba x Populus x berolinensis]